MKILRYSSVILFVLAFAFGCSKDAQQQQPAAGPGQNQAKPREEKAGAVEVTPLAANEIKEVVIIPDGVKARWKTVGITVVNKADNKSTTLNVPIGSDATVPGEKLKISVRYFIPDFTMDGDKITSATDKPNNPSTYIIVSEDGVDVYRGWIFSLYPNMNKFEHSKYALTVSAYN